MKACVTFSFFILLSGAAFSQYPDHIGDIAFDASIDDPAFQPCNENRILQYHSFSRGIQFKGEKTKIEEHFRRNYLAPEVNESGYIIVRFVVNCRGKSGRFRLSGMDAAYQPKEFTPSITEPLLQAVKELNGWLPGKRLSDEYDYYQNLIFKIEKGKIAEILP